MLGFEDSFAKWMGQALKTPQGYFATLAALGFLVGQCWKVARTGFEITVDQNTSWSVGLLAVLGPVLMFYPLIILAWIVASLILAFPGF